MTFFVYVEDFEKILNDAVYSKQRCTPRVILISNKYSRNINAVVKTSLRLVSMIIRETKNRAFMECCKRTYINLRHSSYVVRPSVLPNSIVINCMRSTEARISVEFKTDFVPEWNLIM